MSLRVVLIGIWIGISLASPTGALGASPGAATFEEFARRFVDAVNSRSPERRWELVHTNSRACANAESRPYLASMFARQSKDSIPSNYRLSVDPLPARRPLLFEGDLDYPVRPTHSMQFDYDTGPNRGRLIFIYVARDRGLWSEVLACPRPQALAKMRNKAKESAAFEQRAKLLAAAVPDSLRVGVLSLIRQGRRIDAIMRYASATREDLAMSRRVVELLGPDSK